MAYHATMASRRACPHFQHLRPADALTTGGWCFCHRPSPGPLTISAATALFRSFCYVSDLVQGLRLLLSDESDPVNSATPGDDHPQFAQTVIRLADALEVACDPTDARTGRSPDAPARHHQARTVLAGNRACRSRRGWAGDRLVPQRVKAMDAVARGPTVAARAGAQRPLAPAAGCAPTGCGVGLAWRSFSRRP